MITTLRQLPIFFLLLICISAHSQEISPVKSTKKFNLGFSGNMVDYNPSFPADSTHYGFSVMAWKGLAPKLDLSLRYNWMQIVNRINDRTTAPNFQNHEMEMSLHAKAFDDSKTFNPFLTAGIGGGRYEPGYQAYVPAGVGIQLSLKQEVYVLLQANYRYSFNTNRLPHHNFYSLGITKSFGKRVPPPPVVLDRDKDGVPDNIDACPDSAGLAALQGCPDRDGDGIADKDDRCPDQAGTVALGGCPDKDGDGIADADDACPDVAGIQKYKGCPIPDTDKDGINDEEDKCLTVPGVLRYQGCPIPDTDNDGVNDEEDKCPTLAGPASNSGCPVIPEAVKKRVDVAANNILFVTGSAKLQGRSFRGLDEVVTIMKENPEMKLAIDGHTDNVGSDELNQKLSDNRAASVRDYIISKGIDESRITSAGHGETMPIADNKTAAGRTKNRRVEMTLSYFR